jgi:hypothetical protein
MPVTYFFQEEIGESLDFPNAFMTNPPAVSAATDGAVGTQSPFSETDGHYVSPPPKHRLFPCYETGSVVMIYRAHLRFTALICTLMIVFSNSFSTTNSRHEELIAALHFIDSIQNPHNCSTITEFIPSSMGDGGGFASKFQLGASEFMYRFACGKFQLPVHIHGHLGGYSGGKECAHAKHGWTCFFLPSSRCDTYLNTALKHTVDSNKHKNNETTPAKVLKTLLLPTARQCYKRPHTTEELVPPRFQHLGMAFWWGAMQHYLFRLQPHAFRHIHRLASSTGIMHRSRSFSSQSLLIGLHVRHGDKHTDGFHEHSFEEELQLARNTTICPIQSKPQMSGGMNITTTTIGINCFLPVAKAELLLAPAQLHKNVTTALTEGDNSKQELPSTPMVIQAKDIDRYDQRSNNSDIILNQESRNHVQSLLVPVSVFVASDDVAVIKAARNMGYFTQVMGLSHRNPSSSSNYNNSNDIAFSEILSRDTAMGYNSSLEIIADIYFLSQCNVLVGMAASQIFRIAVGISNATGLLIQARAVDMDQDNKIREMSNFFKVPYFEVFN